MYCATCGTLVDEKLNFCKSCGAKIQKSSENQPKAMFDSLLTSLSTVALGGLGILVGLIAILLKKEFDPFGIQVIAVAYLTVLGAITFMLASHIPKVLAAKSADEDRPPQLIMPQLPHRTTAQLEEGNFQPAVSVVEETTRNFESVPRRKN